MQSNDEVARQQIVDANLNAYGDEPVNLPAGNVNATDTKCAFCEGKLSDPGKVPPDTGGQTCAQVQQLVAGAAGGSDTCTTIKAFESSCCPAPSGVDLNNNEIGAEIARNLIDEDSPAPLPPLDVLNNRLVPFDITRQPRFQDHKKAGDQEEPKEYEYDEDAPTQAKPDAYGTLKEAQPVEEKPRESQPNSDFNFKAYVVNDGISLTNPRLWGAKTLTTPGLRAHLIKSDAKFAAAD